MIDPSKYKLRPKQLLFCEEYIKTGNATQSAIKAGYSKKTARSIGCENLTKPNIDAYISLRMAEVVAKKVASSDEVLEFYTKVVRGEVLDAFGLEASLDTRLDANKQLAKRHGLDKRVVVISGDVPSITVKATEEGTYGEEKQ